MTKKDYNLLAAVLRVQEDLPEVRQVVYDLADALTKDNPRFNRERFLQAALP